MTEWQPIETAGEQASFRATIDGGIGKLLPVEVDGWWDSEGGYHAEEITLTIDGKTYDLIDLLKSRVIASLEGQVEEVGRP